mgnify:CR=1 FL=1
MIRDHDQLSLHVDCDDSAVDADISVSLGLIVTELVINALKHAFEGRDGGTITLHSVTDAGGGCRVLIADDGAGIDTARLLGNFLSERLA